MTLTASYDPLGTGAVRRDVEDKLREICHAKDYGVVANGTTDDTTALKKAIVAAYTQSKTLLLPAGRILVSGELFDYATFIGDDEAPVVIRGQGISSTTIVNHCHSVSPFNLGNSYWTELSDFQIEGVGLGGADGNGHAISLIDPELESGTFKPGQMLLHRIRIEAHTGNALDYAGNVMSSCGIYAVNALSLTIDWVYIRNCSIGTYLYKCYQPTMERLTLTDNLYAGLILDQCERPGLRASDLLDNDSSAPSGNVTLHGGTAMRSGSLVVTNSRGTSVSACKFKDHRYSAISARYPEGLLIDDNWFLLDADGTKAIFIYQGPARITRNLFDHSPFSGTRHDIHYQMGGGFNDIGEVSANLHRAYGGGDLTACLYVDGSAGAPMRGTITGNIYGSPFLPGGDCTIGSAIEIDGPAGALIVTGNRAEAVGTSGQKVKFVTAFDFSGATIGADFVYCDNKTIASGTGEITTVMTGLPSWSWNPPSVAAGGVQTTMVTLSGAVVGDLLLSSFSLALSGLILSAEVSAADTVKFTLFNPTGSAIDLGAGTLRARTIKAI